MEKFVEKFNIFDIFTMLVPGIVISCLFSISLSFKYYDAWKNYGNEKYVLFFVFSYVLGVMFQEIGTILDEKYLWKHLCGGELRHIFLSEDCYKNIFDTELAYKNALDIKVYLKKYINSEIYENASEKEKNASIDIFGVHFHNSYKHVSDICLLILFHIPILRNSIISN